MIGGGVVGAITVAVFVFAVVVVARGVMLLVSLQW